MEAYKARESYGRLSDEEIKVSDKEKTNKKKNIKKKTRSGGSSQRNNNPDPGRDRQRDRKRKAAVSKKPAVKADRNRTEAKKASKKQPVPVKKKKWKTKRKMKILMVLVSILFTLANIIMFSAMWLLNLYGNLSMDEIIFHMTTTIEGTSPDMIVEALLKYALPAVLISIAFVCFLVFLGRKRLNRKPILLLAVIISLVEIFGTCLTVEKKLQVVKYIKDGGDYSTFIDDHYVDPNHTKLTFPEKKRNLIYIYVESMEDTLADKDSGGVFDKNVIPGLTALENEAEDFSGNSKELNGALPMYGSIWTMGGIFAQTTGLPLKINVNRNSMNLMKHFFKKTSALGNILEQNGYIQYFSCGSNVKFGGRGLFFEEHGNYKFHDYFYAKRHGIIPKDYMVFWGFEDKILYEMAKDDLKKIAKKDKPFNYTMLTVDTHASEGYVCDLCENEFGDNQYANVYHCADKQLTEFIEWIKQQDFYENTTVIINGDHCTMASDFLPETGKDYQRRTYTAYLNSAVEAQSDERRQYTTMDCFPTTLAAMGVKIEGDRLGLGTNLFSREPTLLEKVGYDMLDSELRRNSKLMEDMADLATNQKSIISNVRKQTGFYYFPSPISEDSVKVMVDMGYAFNEGEVTRTDIICFPDDPKSTVQRLPMVPWKVLNSGADTTETLGGRNYSTLILNQNQLPGGGCHCTFRIKLTDGKEYYMKSTYMNYDAAKYVSSNLK